MSISQVLKQFKRGLNHFNSFNLLILFVPISTVSFWSGSAGAGAAAGAAPASPVGPIEPIEPLSPVKRGQVTQRICVLVLAMIACLRKLGPVGSNLNRFFSWCQCNVSCMVDVSYFPAARASMSAKRAPLASSSRWMNGGWRMMKGDSSINSDLSFSPKITRKLTYK